MPTHSETRFVPHAPQDMYALVADVAKYPEFLPWCAAARICSRKSDGRNEVLKAELVISFKVFRESFGSRVILCPDSRRIETTYLDGPFRHMTSNWQFHPAKDGCKVEFFVDFEFRNIILQKAMGVVFNQAMQRIVRAFEARAKALYA